MKQLKKVLFALVAFALLGAGSAYAAGVAFTSTSLSRQVRGEGITETLGEVVVTTLAPGGTILVGSTLDIVYSTAITNFTAAAPPVVGTDVVCTGATINCANISISIVGTNTVRVSFITAANNLTTSDSITFARVRGDASAAGVGPITATMSGSSVNPATNPITFTEPIRTVASIIKPSLPAKAPTTVLGVITCAPPSTTAGVNITFTATEAYPQVVTDAVVEQGFSNSPGAAFVTRGVSVVVTITGVPKDFTVTPSALVSDGTTTFGAAPGAIKQTTAGAAITFTYTAAAAPDLTKAEKLTFNYNLGTVAGASIPPGGLTGAVTAKVQIGLITTSGAIRFADNDQGTFTIANIADCQTTLLFPWVAYTGDGAYDTGFAIANTSANTTDAGGTAAHFVTAAGAAVAKETGSVTLYFFKLDGTAGPAPVVLSSGLAGGRTITGTLSTMAGGAFTGYVVAVCNFRYGHGFAFINNPSPGTGGAFAQGYLADVVLANPRAAIIESAGQ